MDRYAIFVDAGYLFSAAGDLCVGTSKRRDLILDAEKATRFLKKCCDNHGEQVHLRTYWYDGAPDAVPTAEQVRIGARRGLKLRLGRLTKHGQKGVDALIVRDLIVLSRNRAVRTAYLMSGDEDVREGVVEAQEFGVSVVLLGIEPLPGCGNQAETLLREADDWITLSREDCTGFISERTREARDPTLGVEGDIASDASPSEFGEEYGRATRSRHAPETVTRILDDRPRIPQPMDARLIREAVRRFGEPLPEKTKHVIRAGFWRGLSKPGT